MGYSAGIISDLFWFQESKKTAPYMIEGVTKKEIADIVIDENIYQFSNSNKSKRVSNKIFRRLDGFSKEILNKFLETDGKSAKIFVLISIMSIDQLFFEFMYEVVKNHIVLGNYVITKKDVLSFLEEKKLESETVANWKDTTINHLSTLYLLMLSEAGIYDKETHSISIPFIDPNLVSLLKNEGFGPFVETITI